VPMWSTSVVPEDVDGENEMLRLTGIWRMLLTVEDERNKYSDHNIVSL